MPGILTARPLTIMLRTLGWAAIPAWPAAGASAILWTGRAELAFLSVATVGANSALTLLLMRAEQARAARYEKLMEQRDAQYERLERLLVGAVATLHPQGRDAPTRPDLRAVR